MTWRNRRHSVRELVTEQSEPTSYDLDLLGLFASSKKDDVALRVIDVAVLYIENSIDAILL